MKKQKKNPSRQLVKYHLFKARSRTVEVIIFIFYLFVAKISYGQTPYLTYAHPVDITTTTPVFEETLDVSAQISKETGMEFNPDGTRLFVTGNDGVFQYSLTVPYQLATATYDNQSILRAAISGTTGFLTGISFGQDGDFMFLSFGGDQVVRISLNNPYDLSSFSIVSILDLSTELGLGEPTDVHISHDGHDLFLLVEDASINDNHRIQHFRLTFAFFLLDYTSIASYSVADEETQPAGMFFFSAGTQLIVTGFTSTDINQYSLNTPYHIASGVTFDDSPFDIAPPEAVPQGVFINPQATKLFVAGFSGIHSFSLVSSDPFTETSANDGTVEGAMQINIEGDSFINGGGMLDEGTHFTVRNGFNNLPSGLVPVISVASHGQTATLTFTGNASENSHSADVPNLRFTFTDAAFTTGPAASIENAVSANSGLGIDFSGNPELRYSAPVDIVANPPQFDANPYDISDEETSPSGLVFDPSGTNLFVIGESSDQGAPGISHYLLEDTPFETTEITSFEGTLFVSNLTTKPSDLAFDPSGFRLFVLAEDNATIFQYRTINPFQITSAVYDGVFFDVSADEAQPTGMVFSRSGTRLFIIGKENREIVQYDLSTSFDLSGGVSPLPTISSGVGIEVPQPEGLVFDPTGFKVLILGSGGNDVSQFSLTDDFDISATTYDGSFSIVGQEILSSALTLNGDGTKLYVIGFVGDDINQYTLADSKVFQETVANDGSVSGEMKIRLHGDIFSGSGTIPAGNYTIDNLPSGLTPSLSIDGSGAVATLSLGGMADPDAHDDATADDIDDLTFTFSDAAFSSSQASEVVNSTNASSGLGIDFDENLLMDQTITFGPLLGRVFGENFEVEASASSGLPVTFSVVSGPVTIINVDEVIINGVGMVTIAADQTGNENYNPALQVTQSFNISKADQTISFAPLADRVFGEIFLVSASSTSGMPVSFSVVSGPISINNNQVEVNGTGMATIASNQAGNENYNPAIEVTQSFEITRLVQEIVIVPIPDKLVTDPPFDISASVDSDMPLTYEVSGPASIDGITLTLDGSSGIVAVTVNQAGNENYTPASAQVTFNVSDPAKTDQTITFDPIVDKIFGQSFTLMASASSGLVVVYTIVDGPVSISGNEVTFTGVGNATIASNQSGNDVFNPAPKVQQTFTINKVDQTITIDLIADKLTSDAAFMASASVGSGLPLTYEVSGPATISGTEITLSGEEGTVTLTVSQAGDETYNPASEQVSFEVATPPVDSNNTPTVAVAVDDQIFESGFSTSELDVSATFTDADEDALTLTAQSANENVTTVSLAGVTLTITEVGAGTSTITLTADDGNGGMVSDEFQVTISQAVTTGIDEEISKLIKVYPNPSAEYMNIEVPDGKWSAHVFGPTGNLISRIDDVKPSTIINTSQWKSGFYYLRLTNDNIHTATKILIAR